MDKLKITILNIKVILKVHHIVQYNVIIFELKILYLNASSGYFFSLRFLLFQNHIKKDVFYFQSKLKLIRVWPFCIFFFLVLTLLNDFSIWLLMIIGVFNDIGWWCHPSHGRRFYPDWVCQTFVGITLTLPLRIAPYHDRNHKLLMYTSCIGIVKWSILLSKNVCLQISWDSRNLNKMTFTI